MTAKKLSSGSIAYYWAPPTKFRKNGCPLQSEALGTDYAQAIERCDNKLNPLLDAWASGTPATSQMSDTFDWLVNEFEKSDEFRFEIGDDTRRNYSRDLALIADYPLKDESRFGELRLAEITKLVTKRLYKKLSEGRESRARAAMRAARRAWNVVRSSEHSAVVPTDNPFADMQIRSSVANGNRAATWKETERFVAAADELGMPSIGTAALIGFEWLVRSVDIISTLGWSHYRPEERPDAVLIKHGKTGQEGWLPLEDVNGNPLFPELESRITATRRNGPLIIMNDCADRRGATVEPWKRDWFRHQVRKVFSHANLPRDLSFTSFRHGGFTEAGNANVSEAGIRALGQHKTNVVQTTYVKRTEIQRRDATGKRRQQRIGKGT